MLCSTPESDYRASYASYKRTHGSKLHIAVDTLGNLLTVVISGAKTQERHEVAWVCAKLNAATGETVELAYADQDCTSKDAAHAAEKDNVELEVVKHATVEEKRRRNDSFC